MFANIADAVLSKIQSWTGIADTLAVWVAGPMVLGLTIQIMWQGVLVIKGDANFHAVDVFAKNIRVFLIWTLALGTGAYASNVVAFFTEMRTELVALFASSAPGTNSYAVLDQSVGKAIGAMQSQMPWVFQNIDVWAGNFTGLVGLASMALMVGCLVVYAMIAAVNLMVIDVMFAIAWAVGPLAIACFAFPALTRVFDAWLGAVLKYTFTAVVVAAVAGIGNGILATFCERIEHDIETLDFLTSAFGALGASGVLIFLALRIPTLAADLAGGIAVNLLSPAAARVPLATTSASMSRIGAAGGRVGANAVAYGAGRMAQGPVGQTLGQMGHAAASSTLGTRALEAAQRYGNVGSATVNMQAGSVRDAFRAGAGTSKGTGSITGRTRPPGRATQAP